jgi:ATP-dependent RNA helicase RhlE
MTFKELNIIEPILKALNEKGYITPTPIQEKAIPQALQRKDILGLAQTGTGKTAAFTIPIIQQLYTEANPRHEIKALILTPTRELAIQINDCIKDYSKHTSVRHGVIFGGVNQSSQVNTLKSGIDILVATPGRLQDLMNQGYVSLNAVRYFVLDEADRMLDMGFIQDIKRLLPKLPVNKQTLFFSATMSKAIASLAGSLLKNPVRIEITPPASVIDTVDQYLYYVEKLEKKNLLIDLLSRRQQQPALIFARTKHGADKLAKMLCKAGIGCEAIHGDKSQNARQLALANFKSKKTRVLIATDIAARGIDIDRLELVINYDLPDLPETYVHRIGRTGRAGHSGEALTFCSSDEILALKGIQKLTGKPLHVIN